MGKNPLDEIEIEMPKRCDDGPHDFVQAVSPTSVTTIVILYCRRCGVVRRVPVTE